MSELEEFMNYLSTESRNYSELEKLAALYFRFKKEKAKPKGFHKDCTSTKHNIGAGYCSDCQP